MLLPCEENGLRNVTLERYAQRVGRYEYLPAETERALYNVLDQELALQRLLEEMKHDMEARYDYSAVAAFRSIDKYNEGAIHVHNLASFLKSVGHFASELELH